MSRKYKFYNKEGLYFISFATVGWIDVFVREEYFQIVIDSIRYCQKEKGLELFCWCIMPSHIHFIFCAKNNNPGDILRDFKTFTSKALQKAIAENPQESRKEWMIEMFRKAGAANSNVKTGQFWQQHNNPIELWTPAVTEQKVEYVHLNPVVAGFVTEPEHWKYSSATDYAGGKGLLDVVLD